MPVVTMFSGVGTGARASAIVDSQKQLAARQGTNGKYLNNLDMKNAGEFSPYMDATLLHAKAQQDHVSTYAIATQATDLTNHLEVLHKFSVKVQEEVAGELDAGDPAVRVQKADELLAQLSNMLNAKGSNGEYLLSGASTGISPIGDITVSNLGGAHPNPNPNTNYYKATQVPMEFDVAGNNIRLSVNAAHPGIRDLVASIHMLKDHATYNVGQVQQMAEGAAARIAQAKSDVVTEGEHVQKVQEQLEAQVATQEDVINGITTPSEADLLRQHEVQKNLEMRMRSLASLIRDQAHLWDR